MIRGRVKGGLGGVGLAVVVAGGEGFVAEEAAG